VERCTDATNAMVGNGDGAPCWQSERIALAGAGGERCLQVTVQTLSTDAWLPDGRLVFTSRCDSGYFVKVSVECPDITVSKVLSFEAMFCESVGIAAGGAVSGAGV
jgi:hypothetical protein